ncbi:hypothetical protein MPTK1_7g14070 [Marchantia polymorpha subsp. ruderalis]|nr:hypothetical protein MARPO_0009s0092 [Marchantia polymorpha]BBN17382.1 hypothetical protein Mp_7g14070 [Marchantia polymorpha subsp. ruderalis]|eukprot:PTQ46987.1 hypothetical protein MARPO_0009s0092 [Marchantia polymorpha]
MGQSSSCEDFGWFQSMKGHESLIFMDQGGMDSCRASVDLLQSFTWTTEEVDDCYRKSQHEVQDRKYEEMDDRSGEKSRVHSLEEELLAESDAIEELETKMQIRLMVAEAVWKGLLRAVEDVSSRATDVKEAELVRVRQELKSRDAVIADLTQELKTKYDELNEVDELRHHDLLDEVSKGKDVAHCLEEKSRSLALMEDKVELLNCKMQELITAHSSLIQEIGSHKEKIEDQRSQIAQHESAVHESERRCQMLLLVVKHLQDEIAVLNSKRLAHEEAAKLAETEMQEQNWKREAEITLIMTALEGRVMDLETELSHLGEDALVNQVETVTSKSRILQRLSSELRDLRASKVALETRLEDTQAVVRFWEENMRSEELKLADNAKELKLAQREIAELERKLSLNESLLRDFETEVNEIRKSEDELKEQQKALDAVNGSLRLEQEKTALLEQELRELKEGHLACSLEENVWEVNFQVMLVSAFMESTFQDFLSWSGKSSGLSENGEERCNRVLCEKSEVNRVGSRSAFISDSGTQLQHNTEGNGNELLTAQARSADICTKSQSVERSESENMRNDVERKLVEEEERGIELRETLQEIEWRSQIENILVLGYAEKFCREQLERKNSYASRYVEVSCRNRELEKEVAELNDLKVVLERHLPSACREIKSGVEEQIQNLLASMHRMEGNFAERLEHLNVRLHQADISLIQKSALLCRSEEGYELNLVNLRKAEAEVDFLGDEVDALMDTLEKVYRVLSHYHPVIQLYPGLAELSKEVKTQVLQRVSDDDG